MININNKSWDKVRWTDIVKLLDSTDDESFFFEFKSDEESNDKLIKEISALSNTYGGYIFLGVNDDKTIGGCKKWTEQRIHNVIHNLITPVPIFDVRKFKIKGATVLVLKIEEGTMPPYITNTGHIYERVSSGSFRIKDSAKLIQLYNKRKDQLDRTKNKIELPPIRTDVTCPANFSGYVDLGFDLVSSQPTNLQKNFYHLDLVPVAEYLRSENPDFSISRIGRSLLISMGNFSIKDDHGDQHPIGSGLQHYMEIMRDGSVRCRVILTKNSSANTTSISIIPYLFFHVFKDVYRMIMGDDLEKHFIYAYKYESLTVVRQFVPSYEFREDTDQESLTFYGRLLPEHRKKYGNNLIIESNRIPKNDYSLIDRRLFDYANMKFTADALFDELFASEHTNLGFIEFGQ